MFVFYPPACVGESPELRGSVTNRTHANMNNTQRTGEIMETPHRRRRSGVLCLGPGSFPRPPVGCQLGPHSGERTVSSAVFGRSSTGTDKLSPSCYANPLFFQGHDVARDSLPHKRRGLRVGPQRDWENSCAQGYCYHGWQDIQKGSLVWWYCEISYFINKVFIAFESTPYYLLIAPL